MHLQLASYVGAGAVGLAMLFNQVPGDGSSGGGGSSANRPDPSAFAVELKKQCRMAAGSLGAKGCDCMVEKLDDGLDDDTRSMMVIALRHANDRNPTEAAIREFQEAGFTPRDASKVQRQLTVAFHDAIDKCMAELD